MKKSLIALAVAGAMTVPMVAQADATLYGEWVAVISNGDNQDLAIEHDTIELGVKGTIDNDIDGLETGFNLLMEGGPTATIDDGLKKMYGYMSGDFGTVTAGKSDNVADIISDTGINGGAYTPNSGRYDSHLSYSTPDMGGFSAAVGITADGSEATDDFVATALMLGYSAGGVSVAISNDSADGAYDITAVAASYEAGDLVVFGSFWDEDESDSDGYSIGAEYGTGAATLYAEYDSQNDDDSTTLVGASYSLGSDAWVGVEFVTVDETDTDTFLAYYGLAW